MQEKHFVFIRFFYYRLQVKIKNDTFASLFQAQRENIFPCDGELSNVYNLI